LVDFSEIYSFSASFLNGDFRLEWRVENDTFDGLIVVNQMNVTAGLGFVQSLTGNPLVRGDWIVGTDVVNDMWQQDNGPGPRDDILLGGTNDVVGNVCEFGGQKFVQFSRPLVTADIYDVAVLTDRSMLLTAVIADGAPFLNTRSVQNARMLSGNARAQSIKINLGSGFVSDIDTAMIIAHAVLMCVAFGLVFVLSIAIGRYLPKRMSFWFYLHAGCSILGVCVVVAGFGVGVGMVANSIVPHFSLATPSKGAHAILGLIAFIWVILQGLLGGLTKVMWNREFHQTSTLPTPKVFPDKIHWYSGYFLPVIGFVNVFLGLYDWGVPSGWMGLWGGWGAAVLVAFIVFEYTKRHQAKEVENEVSQYYHNNAVELTPQKSPEQKVAPAVVDVDPESPIPLPKHASAKPVVFTRVSISERDFDQHNNTVNESSGTGAAGTAVSPASTLEQEDIEDTSTSSADTPPVSLNALAAPETPVKELKTSNTIPMPFMANIEESSSGDDEEEEAPREEDDDEVAKETDGELNSTEESQHTAISSVGTPRRSGAQTPEKEVEMDAEDADALDELEEATRKAKEELRQMDLELQKFAN
jgi:hypothetical protein